MKLLVPAAALSGAALLLAACAHGPPPGVRRARLEVPHRADGTGRGAPAALAAVLSYWGRETSPAELAEELDRDSFSGAVTVDLQRSAHKRGFSAETIDATLAQVRQHLDEGRPLLALQESGPPLRRTGRWLVITGYDDFLRAFYVHDGRERDRAAPYDDFFEDWDDTRRAALLVRPARADAAPPAAPPHSSGMQRGM